LFRRNADLVLVATLAGIGGLIVGFSHSSVLRIVCALPLLLVLPGYALTKALFRRQRLETAAVALLSTSLSLSIAIVGAVGLNTAGFSLERTTWIVFLVALTWVFCLLASRAPAERVPRRRVVLTLRRVDLALLLIAALIVVGAMVLALTVLPAKNVRGYTALSIVPASTDGAVQVTVKSEELHRRAYRVELRVAGQLAAGRSVRLAPGEQWQRSISVDLPPDTNAARVEAVLYRDEQTTPYRTVWLEMRTRAGDPDTTASPATF
jgi:uncharacterized membrane protein